MESGEEVGKMEELVVKSGILVGF